MNRSVVPALAPLILGTIASACVENVGFDEVDASLAPVPITNEYEANGVIFGDVVICDATVSDTCGAVPPFSPPNVAVVSDGPPPFQLASIATLVDPLTGAAATSGFVGITLYDTDPMPNTITVTFQGVDLELIGQLSYTTPDGSLEPPLSVQAEFEGIHRIVVEVDGGSAAFDDLSFERGSVADFNCDGAVDGADLGLLLAAWGSFELSFDLNADTSIDGLDVAVLLAEWFGGG